MRSPLIIAILFFATVMAGAVAGWSLRKRLPKDHLTEETKSVVSVSMAVVATISALVLGLLISNANTAFSALGGEVTALSAGIIRLDNILRRYGSETEPARQLLREFVERKTADLFPEDTADVDLSNAATYELLQRLEDSMLSLQPANERDKWWLEQAMTLAGKIGDIGWLMAQQAGQGTPKAFVVLLAFWLTSLFASFGLFGPPNRTTLVFVVLCALAAAGAIGMILELEKGFGGMVHVSPLPMRQALKALG